MADGPFCLFLYQVLKKIRGEKNGKGIIEKSTGHRFENAAK